MSHKMSHSLQAISTEAQLLAQHYYVLSIDNTSFKEKTFLAYSKQFLSKLLPLLEQANVQGLQNLLAENWQFMNINCLNYTAIPNHGISKLCCNLSASLSELLQAQGIKVSPLELLMPGIETESCHDDYPTFTPTTGEDLQQIIATHILGSTGKYLIPVQSLVDADFEEPTNWPSPYYNYSKPENYQYVGQDKEGFISAEERERLHKHSPETQALRSAWDQYKKLCSDDSTLLGQLKLLCSKLALHDAYQGNGTQENAGGGAYGALITFFDYFEKISEEQKKIIDVDVRNQIDMLYTFLTDSTKNTNATMNVQTCIADRRKALIQSMSGHEEVLNEIGLAQLDKIQLIEKTKNEIAACQSALKAKIEERKYTGQDYLPFNQKLLETLDITIEINTLVDLHDFLSLSAESVKTLLEGNGVLQQAVLNQIRSLDDLIDLSHTIKTPVFEALLDVFGDRLKNKVNFQSINFPSLYFLVPYEVFQIFFNKWIRLDIFKSREYYNNLLTYTANNPESLKVLLNLLPADEQRLEVTKVIDMYNRTVLHLSTVNPESLKLLLNLFTNDEQKIEAIKTVDSSGQTVLHHSAGNSESLKILLDLFSDDEQKIEAIKTVDISGQTVLHHSAGNSESLKILLDLFSDDEQKIEAIKTATNVGRTVLHKSAISPESLKILLDLFSDDEQKIEAIKTVDSSGQTVLHHSAGNSESLKILLDLFSDDEQKIEAIKTVDSSGQTLLHHSACNPESLKKLLSLLQDDEQRIEAIKTVNSSGQNVLYFSQFNSESFNMLLNLFPDNKQKLEAIKTVGSALLSYVAGYPDLLMLLLNILPYDGNKLEIIETVAARQGTLLHRVADNPDLLSMLLNLYPDGEQKLEAVQTPDQHDATVLHCAAGSPDSLRLLLNLYPDGEQKLEAVQKPDLYGQTILHRAVGTLESLKMLLNLYPDGEQKLEAVQKPDLYGQTILHRAVGTPETLKMLLNLYPDDEQRIEALYKSGQGISSDKTVFRCAAKEKSPDSLRTILSAISDKYLRIEIIEKYCSNGQIYSLGGTMCYCMVTDTMNKLVPLYTPILEIESYVLSYIGINKGMIIDSNINEFFAKLKMLIINYEVDGVKNEEKTKQFQIDFATLLHSQDEFMATHRQLWKPILINLLIACTGIGLLAIIGHAISNALIKINKNEQIYTSDLLFFAKTKRQQKLEILEEQISDRHILVAN